MSPSLPSENAEITDLKASLPLKVVPESGWEEAGGWRQKMETQRTYEKVQLG